MGNANFIGNLVKGLVLAPLLLAWPIQCQTLWPGMDSYLEMSLVPRPDTTPTVYLTNLYYSPLVAVSWDYKCTGSRWTRHSGFVDAALTFNDPWAKGTIVGTSAAGAGCTGGITSVIFANGTEIGDPEVLREMHGRRAYALEEVQRTLGDDVLSVPMERWDPLTSVTKLQARIAQLPEITYLNQQEVTSRSQTLEALIRSIEDYRSDVKANPSVYLPRAGKYIEYLQDWEQGLASTSYPSTTFRWTP
jgi:hypothetical protein